MGGGEKSGLTCVRGTPLLAVVPALATANFEGLSINLFSSFKVHGLLTRARFAWKTKVWVWREW